MPNTQTNANTTTQPNSQKLTLTQFINTLDQRIKSLEENTNSISNGFDSKIIDRYNTRFEILANEIVLN